MKEDTKTLQQSKAYFLYLEWIARELREQGITMNKIIEEIELHPTKDSLHVLFKQILWNLYQVTSTKEITREQLSEALDILDRALAMKGVVLSFPEESKRNLLQFY